MKRSLISMVLLLFTFLMFKGASVAADNVVYIDYNAETNEFSLDENQDLFVNLKNVVPGDNLTQKIKLKVINLKREEQVKIYLKAENLNTDYKVLNELEGVRLTVNSNDQNIEEKIYNPLLIGTFTKNNDLNIEVNLAVDKTVGNEIANLYAKIDWIFSAEEIISTDTPQTGDHSNVAELIIICIIFGD